MSTGVSTRRLVEIDVFGTFCSGHPALDRFIAQYAKQNQRKKLSATWLAERDGEVAGYVTIVSGSVDAEVLAGPLPKLPDYPAPVLLLARMATDERHLGQRVGSHLMREVFREALAQADRSGCVGVLTDAKPPEPDKPRAENFYRKFEFVTVREPTEEKPTTGMFLPLKLVKKRLLMLEAELKS